MNESEKREVEEDFWKFMRDSIWYCARNVTCGSRYVVTIEQPKT